MPVTSVAGLPLRPKAQGCAESHILCGFATDGHAQLCIKEEEEEEEEKKGQKLEKERRDRVASFK